MSQQWQIKLIKSDSKDIYMVISQINAVLFNFLLKESLKNIMIKHQKFTKMKQ